MKLALALALAAVAALGAVSGARALESAADVEFEEAMRLVQESLSGGLNQGGARAAAQAKGIDNCGSKCTNMFGVQAYVIATAGGSTYE